MPPVRQVLPRFTAVTSGTRCAWTATATERAASSRSPEGAATQPTAIGVHADGIESSAWPNDIADSAVSLTTSDDVVYRGWQIHTSDHSGEIMSNGIMTTDDPAAAGVAEAVREAHRQGNAVAQRRVNWLLDQFNVAHLDATSATDMERRLQLVGISVEPSLAGVTQAASVSLALLEPGQRGAADCGIRHWTLLPDGTTEETSYAAVSSYDGAVHWFDIDLSCSAEDVYAELSEHCEGLTEEMVDDLRDPDVQPKVISHGDMLRSVSLVGVHARSRTDENPAAAQSTSGELAFQLVESLVGPGWIVTCWHNSRICAGAIHDRDGEPMFRDAVIASVRSTWASESCKTSGDVGTALASELVATHPAAYRELEAWLQRWEMRYYRMRCQADESAEQEISPEVGTLNNLLSLVTEFRRRSAAQDNARGLTAEAPWYPGVSVRDLDDAADRVLDGVLSKLQLLFDNVRADMELVSMNAIAAQATASARQAEEVARTAQLITKQGESDERFQRQLGKVTALLLVPSLIAGMFGANTAIPGYGNWFGFELMLLHMAASSLVVYLYGRPKRPPVGRATSLGPPTTAAATSSRT